LQSKEAFGIGPGIANTHPNLNKMVQYFLTTLNRCLRITSIYADLRHVYNIPSKWNLLHHL